MHSNLPDSLLACLVCPRCTAALRLGADGFACAGCSGEFPYAGRLPWLLPEPSLSRAEWRRRLDAQLAVLADDRAELRAVAAGPGLAAPARTRLRAAAHARAEQSELLAALLEPVLGPAPRYPSVLHAALDSGLPSRQGLNSYYANLHRDWCWGDAEHAGSLELLRLQLDGARPRRVLVLGAGAGRLAYDLHAMLCPEWTVALDLNPLLSEVARRMFAGESLELYEFPLAPRSTAEQALRRRLGAPSAAQPGLVAVVGDALQAPLAPGSVDLVVTPWLIDVLDLDFAAFAPRVNSLLAPDGLWLNAGPLAWTQPDLATHYGPEEVGALLGAAGFGVIAAQEHRMPYLQSPASRQARIETVFAFAARKRHGVTVPALAPAGPQWLRDSRAPIPALPAFEQAALAMRVNGYLASLIDGQRSLADLTHRVVADRLLLPEDAEATLRGFLRRLHDDALRRRSE